MICLTKEEMNEINGGISFGSKVFLFGGLISFIIGIIDGLIKLKWQNHKNIVFVRNLKGKPLIQIRRKGSIMFIKLLDLMLT